MGRNSHSFPNFNGTTVDVLGMEKKFHPTLHWAYDYLYMLRLKLIHASKQCPSCEMHIEYQHIHFGDVEDCDVIVQS